MLALFSLEDGYKSGEMGMEYKAATATQLCGKVAWRSCQRRWSCRIQRERRIEWREESRFVSDEEVVSLGRDGECADVFSRFNECFGRFADIEGIVPLSPGRQMSTAAGSLVFLTGVDDYTAPSQACINPLFTTNKTI